MTNKFDQARLEAKSLNNETAANLMDPVVKASREWAEQNPEATYQDDLAALEWIRSEITAGCLSEAYSYACTLDTAVREEIPMAVWVYIGGELLG